MNSLNILHRVVIVNAPSWNYIQDQLREICFSFFTEIHPHASIEENAWAYVEPPQQSPPRAIWCIICTQPHHQGYCINCVDEDERILTSSYLLFVAHYDNTREKLSGMESCRVH